MKCPSCKSLRIDTRNYGRRTLGAIGGAAGAAGATTGSLTAIEMGTFGVRLGRAAGMPGMILGGLVGAMAGMVAGAKAGELVDDLILNNYVCLKCGHGFSSTMQYAPSPPQHESSRYLDEHEHDTWDQDLDDHDSRFL